MINARWPFRVSFVVLVVVSLVSFSWWGRAGFAAPSAAWVEAGEQPPGEVFWAYLPLVIQKARAGELPPTSTPTQTATPTITPIFTPSPTATPTATASPTTVAPPTKTPSPTSVWTVTPTASPTATASLSPTPQTTTSPTPTATASLTPTPLVTSSPTATATKTPSPTPTSAAGQCEEKLVNGDFSSGRSSWLFGNLARLETRGYSNPNSAYLSHNEDYVAQKVTIPADTTRIIVHFWMDLGSFDTSSVGNDVLWVEFSDLGLEPLWPIGGFDNTDADDVDGWEEHTFTLSGTALSLLRGQTVYFDLYLELNDDNLQTWAYLDDFSLQVCREQ